MRIVLFYLGKKGVQNVYALQMAKGLVQNGSSVLCVLSSYCDNYDDWVALRDAYPGSLMLVFVKTGVSALGYLRVFNVFSYVKIMAVIRDFSPDAVYFTVLTFWTAVMAMPLRRYRFITTMHDPKIHMGEESFILNSMYKSIIRRSSDMIVLSKCFVDEVAETYGKARKSVHHIPLADLSNETAARAADATRETDVFHRILFFGRIVKYKGLSVLLESMEKLRTVDPMLTLRVVGDGEIDQKSVELIESLGDRVELVNRWIDNSEVPSFFRGIDFTVLPYVEASQSGVIMISYSYLKPVVTTSVGALPEYVTERTGLIVPPSDPDALARAIVSMYEDPARILEMGLAGRDFVRDNFTWDSSAKKLIDIVVSSV